MRCLQCIEAQTESPQQVIVVDASDDPVSVKTAAMAARRDDIEWVWVDSSVRSIPAQRNLGVARARAEVVFMPDDDSLFYPTAAAEIMAAYRNDAEGIVAGVSARGAAHSPLDKERAQISRAARVQARVLPVRNRIERAIVPRPFETYPQSLWGEQTFPRWVDGDIYVPVETIGGYLLTLRTDRVRDAWFDETLGYAVGYAQHEDMEMSLRFQKEGHVLIAAHRAQIFHDVHPSKRAGGFAYGFCWIANYVYVCARNIPRETRSWNQMYRFLRYKLFLYWLRALVRRDDYNRELLDGARIAWAHRDELIGADEGGLANAYRGLCDTFLRPRQPTSSGASGAT